MTTDVKKKFYWRKKKVCKFCVDKIYYIDYKDVELLQQFLSDGAKIVQRRISGVCAKHQRMLSRAIKRARIAALLPFISQE